MILLQSQFADGITMIHHMIRLYSPTLHYHLLIFLFLLLSSCSSPSSSSSSSVSCLRETPFQLAIFQSAVFHILSVRHMRAERLVFSLLHKSCFAPRQYLLSFPFSFSSVLTSLDAHSVGDVKETVGVLRFPTPKQCQWLSAQCSCSCVASSSSTSYLSFLSLRFARMYWKYESHFEWIERVLCTLSNLCIDTDDWLASCMVSWA